jgi:hypothetical protein
MGDRGQGTASYGGMADGIARGTGGVSRRMLSPAEIQARLPVWDAIADLFLDTVIDTPIRDYVARELAGSPFTVDELEAIYRYEVAPVVHWNLKIIAGEWAGFHQEWLAERIPAYLAKRGPLERWWARSLVGRWWRTSRTNGDWQKVIRQVVVLRAAA